VWSGGRSSGGDGLIEESRMDRWSADPSVRKSPMRPDDSNISTKEAPVFQMPPIPRCDAVTSEA
jgi:hypothetical protein